MARKKIQPDPETRTTSLPNGVEIAAADGEVMPWHIRGVGRQGEGMRDVLVVARDRDAARRLHDQFVTQGWTAAGAGSFKRATKGGVYVARVVTRSAAATRRARVTQLLADRPALASQVEADARRAWTDAGGDAGKFQAWLSKREGTLAARAELERVSDALTDAAERHQRQLTRYIDERGADVRARRRSTHPGA
jgi:hypothetical protein